MVGLGKERTPAYAAETEVVSKELQFVHFSDGSSLQVEITEDVIRITGTHVKSDNRYSYATAGFNITLEPTGGMVEQKAHLPVTMISKTETITDVVTTTYLLDRESVYNAAFQLFEQQHAGSGKDMNAEFLKQLYENKGLDFYLHNAFQVIERSGGSGSSIISASRIYHSLGSEVGSNGRIPGILNAIYELYGLEWSAATKAKLREYYDIHMKLSMEPCSAGIVLVTEEGEIIKQAVTDYALVQYAKMRYVLPTEYTEPMKLGEQEYRLTEESVRKSYVCYGDSAQKAQSYAPDAEYGLMVRLGNRTVAYKHLFPEDATVYLVCEQINATEDIPEENEEQEEIQRIRISLFQPLIELELGAEPVENPRFEVCGGGIPVNEDLCLNGTVSTYLLQAEFAYHKGKYKVWVPIEKTYELHWNEVTGYVGEESVEEEFVYEKTKKEYLPVSFEYSYIEVSDVEYYRLSSVCVRNRVLPDGQAVVTGEELEAMLVPSLSYGQCGESGGHLLLPEEIRTGICLEKEIIYGEGAMPAIPEEDFAIEIAGKLGEIQVRDDAFVFGGREYLSTDWRAQEPSDTEERLAQLQEISQESVKVQKHSVRIPEQIKNGEYPSSAEISYQRAVSMKQQYPDTLVFQAAEINPILVHTPVYCEGILKTDNKQYCQLTDPDEGAEVLVLDEAGISSDFTVSISNYGYHSAAKGYGTRDYSVALSDSGCSYIARAGGQLRNEVCFPFDVFWDVGMDYDASNDIFYTAGQWLTIGKQTMRYYLPEWVKEGRYEIAYRTIAVNGENYPGSQESKANTQLQNYVAVDYSRVEVSGKLYGFRIYDIADYPAWQAVFRNDTGGLKRFFYTAGTCDEYGNAREASEKYTIPILSGSHPFSVKEYLKPGYAFRFSVCTNGRKMASESSFVEIIPSFYHVDATGNGRREVDLYYCQRDAEGKKRLIKIGSPEDKEYEMVEQVGSPWLGIPERELKATAEARGIAFEEYKRMREVLYSYSGLRSRSCFRTFCNFAYAEQLENSGQWNVLIRTGISRQRLHTLQQCHYFAYSLPYEVYAVPAGYRPEYYELGKGTTLTEEFWIREGYIIVNFEITAYAENAAYLSYANRENRGNGYCSMWSKEKMPSEKADGTGKLFYFEQGDIFCFPVNSSIQQDYIPGGIY
ncbi:MAG: hypothetical protein IJY09_09245 [Lachnospiraceae bacterium]|nr:hypothetical protein [Lachnospiraceae bacterium]